MTGSSAVIDASVAVKTVLPDPLQERCEALIARLVTDGYDLVAPALWLYESTSALCKMVYLGQLRAPRAYGAVAQIMALGIELVSPDEAQSRRALDWSLQLKRAVAYDSYYLALAERLGCDLWTADRRLANAVNLPWVRWVGDG